jgi:hypothetical protein
MRESRMSCCRAAEAAIRAKKECVAPDLLQSVIGARAWHVRADAIHHPGLPTVPAPARDELVGARGCSTSRSPMVCAWRRF